MSAEMLHEAAAKMRERAEAATDENDWRRAVAKFGRRTPKGQHIATFATPAVALAVAAWLDEVADYEDGHGIKSADTPAALAVARAYLAT